MDDKLKQSIQELLLLTNDLENDSVGEEWPELLKIIQKIRKEIKRCNKRLYQDENGIYCDCEGINKCHEVQQVKFCMYRKSS